MKMGKWLIIPLLVGAISACAPQPVATVKKAPEQQPASDDEPNNENYVDAAALKVRRQKLKEAHLAKQKQFYIKRKPAYETHISPKSTVHTLTQNTDKPPKTNITNIHLLQAPLIAQMPELPRGCEVTSLAMLLQYAGVKVGKMELAKKVDKVPFIKNGLHGNPHNGFVGDMYSFKKPGIGVFHEPIAKLARFYLGNRVKDLSGSSWKAVENQIDQGKPVWVIVTSRYKWLPDSYWQTWKTASGPVRITYKEHAVLITGYSNYKVYFNDPLAVIKNRSWAKKEFVAGWRQFGSQAISYN